MLLPPKLFVASPGQLFTIGAGFVGSVMSMTITPFWRPATNRYWKPLNEAVPMAPELPAVRPTEAGVNGLVETPVEICPVTVVTSVDVMPSDEIAVAVLT